MDVFPPLLFSWSFVSARGRLREFRVRRIKDGRSRSQQFSGRLRKAVLPMVRDASRQKPKRQTEEVLLG